MGMIGLIIALLAIAVLLRIDFIFYIVYVVVGLYAISQFLTPRVLSRLLINREYNDHAFLGESVSVRLKCKNQSRLPLPWLEFNESIPPEIRVGNAMQQVISLGGRVTESFTYQVQAGRRGYYRLGPLRLTTGDLFGFLPRKHGTLPPNYLTVYPHIVPLSRLGLPSRLPFGAIASQQRLFEDPARPQGVREYRTSDSMRQINWKVSAHMRDLLVKTYEPSISLETAVLLNLHASDYARKDRRYFTELAIVAAASLAAHLIDRRQPVGLATNGVDPLAMLREENDESFNNLNGRLLLQQSDTMQTSMPPQILPRSGRAHLMKILEYLARIEPENTIPLIQWLSRASLNLSWGVTILIISATGDDATCQTIHRLVRSGFNPILIAVEPDYNFAQVRERARRLGFRAYNVTAQQDLGLL